MEPEEFNKVMKGLRFHNNINYNSSVMFMDDNVTGLPAEVDWRKEGYVTEVKDQGRCGSCWAFAATGSLEGQLYKKIGKLVSLSEQDLVDCAGSCGTDGCNGGLMQPAYECIKKMGGIESEKDYPYEGKDNKCRFSKKKSITTLSGYMNFKRFDEKALQKAVTHFGPIAAAIDTSDPKFSHYKTGIFQSSSCSPIYLDHAVLVVGYGTENGKDFWLVKNSWGLSWGMNGYFKIARNQNNTCGIASYTCCPIV